MFITGTDHGIPTIEQEKSAFIHYEISAAQADTIFESQRRFGAPVKYIIICAMYANSTRWPAGAAAARFIHSSKTDFVEGIANAKRYLQRLSAHVSLLVARGIRRRGHCLTSNLARHYARKGKGHHGEKRL